MKNIRIYDNGGASFDRYTVVFMNEPEYQPARHALGMSEHPFHPQGFGQHCAAMPGNTSASESSLKTYRKIVKSW